MYSCEPVSAGADEPGCVRQACSCARLPIKSCARARLPVPVRPWFAHVTFHSSFATDVICLDVLAFSEAVLPERFFDMQRPRKDQQRSRRDVGLLPRRGTATLSISLIGDGSLRSPGHCGRARSWLATLGLAICVAIAPRYFCG